MSGRFSIAQFTPYSWEEPHEVNEVVRRISGELSARGHRVLVVAPSSSVARVRDGRRLIRSSGESLLEHASDEPLVLAVGEALPALPGRSRAALPMDVTRTLGDLLDRVALDICHVHEPFAPSVASAALRASRALNVGSFHAPAEPLVATQVARKVVELVFGRLDARTASYEATAAVMNRHFPATYRLLRDGSPAGGPSTRSQDGPLRIAFVDHGERPALRLLLRAPAARHAATRRGRSWC